jgi:zinc transporter, ZIP family
VTDRPETKVTPRPDATHRSTRAVRWLFGLLPVVLLAILIGLLLRLDPLAALRAGIPPVEDLAIERVTFSRAPRTIDATLVNGGPEPVTVAQVLVDEAYWPYLISPDSVIDPLRSATIHLEYPWVQGEPLDLVVLTSSGLTFHHAIDVATSTPQTDVSTMADLAVLGAFVGLFPVLIGLCWFPFVRRLGNATIRFLLALSAGVLLFLALDATVEAAEVVPTIPTAFRGTGVFLVAVVVSVAVLIGLGTVRRRAPAGSAWGLAVTIAIGIGLHNLGEGLAIGAAFALGKVALTSVLVVGFAVHNSSEGLAIVSPLAHAQPRVVDLMALGAMAGAPTIIGTWIGALAYSPALAVFFLGLGVGAIGQVLWELARLIGQSGSMVESRLLLGLATGVVIMYLTAVVAAG